MSRLGMLAPGPRDGPPLDPGLQAERTAMAWQRTALGVGGVGAVLLHEAGADLLAAIAGGLGLLFALALLLAVDARYDRTVRRIEANRSPASPGLVGAVSVAALVLALGAVLLVLRGAG